MIGMFGSLRDEQLVSMEDLMTADRIKKIRRDLKVDYRHLDDQLKLAEGYYRSGRSEDKALDRIENKIDKLAEKLAQTTEDAMPDNYIEN